MCVFVYIYIYIRVCEWTWPESHYAPVCVKMSPTGLNTNKLKRVIRKDEFESINIQNGEVPTCCL